MRARRDDDDYDDAEDDYDDDDDERPRNRSKRGRSGQKPGKVVAIGIMTLIGGILACIGALWSFFFVFIVGLSTIGLGFLCCLWPGPYYGVTAGILAIVKGSQLLGQKAQSLPPPRGTGILLTICGVEFAHIFILDVISCLLAAATCVLGILVLVFCNDPEVENWFKG